MPTEKVRVEGMRDEADMEKVRHALHEVWGVREVRVATGEVMFSYDERAGALGDFLNAIRSSGFEIVS